MLPSPLTALLVAFLSSLFVQHVSGATPLLTLPIERRTLHNSVSHRPASYWEDVKDRLRAKYGYGNAKVAAIKAIQRRDELAKRAVGTFGLADQFWDSNYVVSINIGTPPQQFSVIPDTGSSETWVIGSQCVTCTSTKQFDTSKSSTYTPLGQTAQFKYGSGSVVADLAYETISMGVFKSEKERISTASSQKFLQQSASGILGLGFPPLMATANTVPWWIRLIQDGQLGQNQTLFAFWLSRYWGTPQTLSTQELPGGQFTLGGVNTSLFTGEINYVRLAEVNWWTIPMDSVVVNGHEIMLTASTTNAIIDTGTTLVGGPKEVLDVMFANINGSIDAGTVDPRYDGYYLIPCNAMNTISLGFKFGGQVYTFTGIDLISDDVSNTPGLEGMCLSSIFVIGSVLDNQVLGTNGPAWLVGDAFLKNVYSVYRYETTVTGAMSGSVGFARLSGVDGRLTTTGATMYPTPTSGPNSNIPTTSRIPNGLVTITILDPLDNSNPLRSNSNGAGSSGLQMRGSEYRVLIAGVSLLLSLVW